MRSNDDSSGKQKANERAKSSAALSTVLILGTCVGFVVAEKLYLKHEEAKTTPAQLASLRSRKLELGAAQQHDSLASLATTASSSTTEPSLFIKGRQPRSNLEKILQRIAPDGEIMIAISNMNLIRSESLVLWLQGARRIQSTNWLVVAIDEELRDYCVENKINHYYRPVKIPDTQANTGDNHAISAMKYEIIEEFLTLGYDVLLSDVDIVIVEDPLLNLYRDHDVEGMSDGFDDSTAYGEIYGIDDESMGWSRYAQGVRHMVMNSGLFYLKANSRTIDLMQRIAARLHKEKAWDQSVYNEEVFFLSHGERKSPQVTVRVMDRLKFMNSKTLFKIVRHMPRAQQPNPVMVHMNYHPDKVERMKGAIEYYWNGNMKALDPFPGGSEPGSR
ncbi:hypothetical protein Ndes2526B_g08029 [Nannochloris sp. 'desiccata']|nr:hypothetical protein KSW81_002673 [Chlorella desiccata (nom. nud.)]